jgi:hypothetical protein
MNVLVPLALFGWAPVVFFIFMALPPRRAVIISFLGAWLFLPIAKYKVPGLPDISKMFVTSVSVLLCTTLLDLERFKNLRLSRVDLFMATWCLVPLASSLSNDLGVYDGLSGCLQQVITWGLPYLIGRIYFSDLESLHRLAIAIFIGGLIYVPLCLFEVRMSPQLHRIVYGYHQHMFSQTLRFGGYRPVVFMDHGLMVGLWMTSASLVGFRLWRSRALITLGGFPAGFLWIVLVATAILCKSLGALVLLVLGLLALSTAGWYPRKLGVKVLFLFPLIYMGGRSIFDWQAEELRDAALLASEERAGSLLYRIHMEDLLIARAKERPLLGWGGWGRNRVFDKAGKDITITDGLWIIALGVYGMVGLVAITGAVLYPAYRFFRLVPARRWNHPTYAGPVALAILLPLYGIDNLFNADVNPIYMLVAGGVATVGIRIASNRKEAGPSAADPVTGRAQARD